MVFKEKELPLRDKDLPVLIREVVSNAPQNRKLPSFIACLSPLCALATRIRLKYDYDSRPCALLLQVIIEAPQSSGKQFAADIERLLLDDTLKARDQLRALMQNLNIKPVRKATLYTKHYTLNNQPDIPYLERLMCQPVLNAEAERFLFQERKLNRDVIRQLGNPLKLSSQKVFLRFR